MSVLAKRVPAVIETRTVEVSPPGITVTMDTTTASVLKLVLAMIGGPPEPGTARGYMANLSAALDAVGVSAPTNQKALEYAGGLQRNSIYFNDTVVEI
jgi:hypothetical protein